jgi:hypothetical protein
MWHRVTTCCTYQGILVGSSRCNINTVPCVRQCARTDGSVGSACHDWVDCKDQGSYRVTTRCTYQCILVGSSSSNINTVPCVRQCARTDGSVGSACYDWVDCKDQCSHRVTTCRRSECVFISSSRCDAVAVPCVRQCTRTDGSIGSACYDWVDSKYQGGYRVTTCCTYQSILVCYRQ